MRALLNRSRVEIDHRRRALIIDGGEQLLQEQVWQVLLLLLDAAPAAVPRTRIIDEVWSGRYATGDKGLNQALWVLRVALGDDARDPRFIRTLPRLGYQWIGPQVSMDTRVLQPIWLSRLAASIVCAVFFVAAGGDIARNAPVERGGLKIVDADVHAVDAYIGSDNIVVRLSSGCIGIIRSAPHQYFGHPVLSNDGRHIAFTVNDEASCKLVTLGLHDGIRRDYGHCPTNSS